MLVHLIYLLFKQKLMSMNKIQGLKQKGKRNNVIQGR